MKRSGLYALMAISLFLLCCNAGLGTDASLLRIDTPCGWTEHIKTAQGSTFYLVVLPGREGDATFYHGYPNGSMQNYSYFLLGYDRLPAYADVPGRHIFSYSIAGRKSNSVTVDVLAALGPAPCPPPCPEPERAVMIRPAVNPARHEPISLARKPYYDPAMIQYYPVGSHIMNYQNGIVIPKSASQYHFGRDFSLGSIDGNYPGTPFILQYLSDP